MAGYNKGGLIVKVGKIRGFVPASQLVTRGEENADPGKRLASLVGRKLHLKVIELDREQNRLILSERAAERQWRKQQKEKMLSELKEGDVLDGTVISLADFGAFIDLGGADGLVHLSEISWQPINKPIGCVQGRAEGQGASAARRSRAQARGPEHQALRARSVVVDCGTLQGRACWSKRRSPRWRSSARLRV